MDGADSTNNRMPYLGTSKEFDKALTQHIQLVLDHRRCTLYSLLLRLLLIVIVIAVATYYRSFDNIPKGSNLTIYTILRFLQDWLREFKKFPDELWIQIDGGSENANKVVLAFLELLVAKKIIKEIYLNRHKVGHTHIDGDAVFGRTNQDLVNDNPCERPDHWIIGNSYLHIY
jgi:hypothetical protein